MGGAGRAGERGGGLPPGVVWAEERRAEVQAPGRPGKKWFRKRLPGKCGPIPFFFFSPLSSISRRPEQGERDGPVLFRVLMLQRGGAGSDFPVIALASFYFPVRSALQ